MTKQADTERAEAIEKLRTMVRPGATVYTLLRRVSGSGMSRSIDLYIMEDNRPVCISFWAARAMRDKIDQKYGGIKIGGAGMDMGFSLVYNLSATLFPNGFGCVGDTIPNAKYRRGCPSNDHSNGDRNYTPDAYPEIDRFDGTPEDVGHTHWHRDGGYALIHDWL